MHISDDSELAKVDWDSLEEGASSFDSFEALLSNVSGEVNRVEVLIPPPILT